MAIAAPAACSTRCSPRRASSGSPGAHCYAFYAGLDAFDALHEEEPGTFYLTDFLVRHFERLIVAGLGLDRHPELLDDYFRHYRRVVYLAQAPTPALMARRRGRGARSSACRSKSARPASASSRAKS